MKPRSRPSLLVSITSTGGRVPVAAFRLDALARFALRAEGVKAAELSIAFIPPRMMAKLNCQHLGHRGPTDVITFALGSDPMGVLRGDIYICVDVARAQAAEHRVGVREEVKRLVVHGVLHACGHEHPTDDTRTTSAMWRRQEALLRRFEKSVANRASP